MKEPSLHSDPKENPTDPKNLEELDLGNVELDFDLKDLPDDPNVESDFGYLGGEETSLDIHDSADSLEEPTYDRIDELLHDDAGNGEDVDFSDMDLPEDSYTPPDDDEELSSFLPDESAEDNQKDLSSGDPLMNMISSSEDYNSQESSFHFAEPVSNSDTEDFSYDPKSLGEDEFSGFEADPDLELDDDVPFIDEELNRIIYAPTEEEDIPVEVDTDMGSELDLSDLDSGESFDDHADDLVSNTDELDSLPDFNPEESEHTGIEDEDGPVTLSLGELDHILNDPEENETAGFEPEDDGPIALSPDELNEVTGESDIDLDDLDQNSLPELDTSGDSGFEPEDDGPIALSADELNEVTGESDIDPDELSSGGIPELDTTTNTDSGGFEPEDDGPITLSLDELDHITNDESLSREDFNEAPAFETDATHDSMDYDSDEPIALSLDELENIISNEEDSGTDSESSETLPHSEDLPLLAPSIEEDHSEDEQIALSDEELSNILNTDAEIEGETLENSDLDFNLEGESKDESEMPSWENAEEEHEDITLSLDELDHITEKSESESDIDSIIGDIPLGETLTAKSGFVNEEQPSDEFIEDEIIFDLDDYAEEGGVSPKEELRGIKPEPITDKIEKIAEVQKEHPSVSKDEMKKMMSYLDDLLGNLPDTLIREFSKSDYFELYKKIMKEIGLKE